MKTKIPELKEIMELRIILLRIAQKLCATSPAFKVPAKEGGFSELYEVAVNNSKGWEALGADIQLIISQI